MESGSPKVNSSSRLSGAPGTPWMRSVASGRSGDFCPQKLDRDLYNVEARFEHVLRVPSVNIYHDDLNFPCLLTNLFKRISRWCVAGRYGTKAADSADVSWLTTLNFIISHVFFDISCPCFLVNSRYFQYCSIRIELSLQYLTIPLA